jgi:hypothetical protein
MIGPAKSRGSDRSFSINTSLLLLLNVNTLVSSSSPNNNMSIWDKHFMFNEIINTINTYSKDSFYLKEQLKVH